MCCMDVASEKTGNKNEARAKCTTNKQIQSAMLSFPQLQNRLNMLYKVYRYKGRHVMTILPGPSELR